MKCECGKKYFVIGVMSNLDGSTWRRKSCCQCGKKITTTEVEAENLNELVKKRANKQIARIESKLRKLLNCISEIK